jgi:hypothetical protein
MKGMKSAFLAVFPLALRVAGVAGLLVSLSWPVQMTDQLRRDGQRIIRSLENMERESLRRKSGSPRRAEFTESEFNSYIAYRIAAEKEDTLKELKLRLFADNRIEGAALIDLGGQNLPAGFKPRMRLFFEARFRTENGRIKVDLQKLFLEGQPVPIPFFDAIIAFAAAIGKSDAGSFNDWYELPYGLKTLRTEPGRLFVYY